MRCGDTEDGVQEVRVLKRVILEGSAMPQKPCLERNTYWDVINPRFTVEEPLSSFRSPEIHQGALEDRQWHGGRRAIAMLILAIQAKLVTLGTELGGQYDFVPGTRATRRMDVPVSPPNT